MQRSNNRRVDRANSVPTWRGAATRAAIAAGVFFLLLLLLKQPPLGAVFISIAMFAIYVPMGYYTDSFLYNRRQRKEVEAAARHAAEKAEKKARK